MSTFELNDDKFSTLFFVSKQVDGGSDSMTGAAHGALTSDRFEPVTGKRCKRELRQVILSVRWLYFARIDCPGQLRVDGRAAATPTAAALPSAALHFALCRDSWQSAARPRV